MPRYELTIKRPEVAQSYLDQAVRIDPTETLVSDLVILYNGHFVGSDGAGACEGSISLKC